MSATWAINGTPLATLGLKFVGGTFNTGTTSVMKLQKAGDFTAADTFAWGTAVTLTRDGVPYFQGKVNSLPVAASDADESQEIQIVDVWKDLEETIYKEEWLAGATSVMLPIAILGRKSNGAECTDAEQIQEAVAYAVSAGVAIQMGSIPAGLPLWQSEVRNVAVAEVIRLSLRFHPDWVPWLDHTTTPPTLNFTPRAGMASRTIDIGDGDTSSVSITRRDDLKPDAVEILYLNPTIIEGVTYRNWIPDRFPAGGPTSGPRVISNVVELAGGQMQFQKQRIQTRKIPIDDAECLTWLKKSYPQIKNIPESHYAVRFIERRLVPEDAEDDLPPLINPNAERLHVTEVEDLPRELVNGTLEDWMRKKSGQVIVDFDLRISPAATHAERKLLEPIAAAGEKTVTGTNATTKIYKGVTQWVAPEEVPAGIAAAIYNSLSAYQYEGSITTVMEDVSGVRFHGCRLNIGGGRGEWAGMNAMIHSVSFDIASGRTTINVGPAPFLAAENMLQLQRLLRGRKVTWMSEDERKSKELGAEQKPGSKGDSVGGFTAPTNQLAYRPPWRFLVTFDKRTKRLHVGEGSVAWEDAGQPDSVTRPFIPKLDDVSLSENPSWNVAGKSPGKEYEVICIYHSSAGRMVLHEKDGEEELEMEDGERARLIASVTFAAGESGLEISELIQKWHDDIEHGGDDATSSSFSGDSEEEESEDESDDSGTDDSGSDDSNSNSSSSSSSGGCCPTTTIDDAVVIAVGTAATQDPLDWPNPLAVCYGGAGMPEDTLIYVNTTVEPPSNCATYRGRLWLVVSVGGVKKSKYLGNAMGGSFSTEHLISAVADADYEVTACVEMFGPPVAGAPPLDDCCAEPLTITMPGACGE